MWQGVFLIPSSLERNYGWSEMRESNQPILDHVAGVWL